MKVRCKFCSHESKGACTKKVRKGKPEIVKVNKPRTCNLYNEDAVRVLSDFRAREKQKQVVARSNARFQYVKKLMEEKSSDED